jgi:hypothetical protein
MDLFKELISVIKTLKGKKYLLTGGLAYAIYVQPRFTEDIDFVIAEEDFDGIRQRLNRLGFLDQKNILVFKKAKIGRCIKVKNNDTLIVDFLLQPKNIFYKFYQRRQVISQGKIKINVIALEDLVRLKRARHSAQDKLDINRLMIVLKERPVNEK